MAKTFKIKLTGRPGRILKKAKQALEAEGGSLKGDAQAGTVEGKSPAGKIVGNYKMDGDTVTITISKKPMLVPSSKIETKLKEFFRP